MRQNVSIAPTQAHTNHAAVPAQHLVEHALTASAVVGWITAHFFPSALLARLTKERAAHFSEDGLKPDECKITKRILVEKRIFIFNDKGD